MEQQRQQQQRDLNAATHLISHCPSSHRGHCQNENENGPQGPMHNRHLLTASQNNTCHRGELITAPTYYPGIIFQVGY